MDRSPLSRLTAEIRNRIYRFSLISDSPLELINIRQYNGLACTCREIRTESRPLFWVLNRFHHNCPVPLTWPLAWPPAQQPEGDAWETTLLSHSEKLIHLLVHALGFQIFGLGPNMTFYSMSANQSRMVMTVYTGKQAVAKNPWTYQWQRRLRIRADRLDPVDLFVPLDFFFKAALIAYHVLGFNMFARFEHKRFNEDLLSRTGILTGTFYELCALLSRDVPEA